ncbi:unnamed protein product [Closterium sp. Yama58-4]|nr:unnamed protein product [Closterium sp. Yama58-4]
MMLGSPLHPAFSKAATPPRPCFLTGLRVALFSKSHHSSLRLLSQKHCQCRRPCLLSSRFSPPNPALPAPPNPALPAPPNPALPAPPNPALPAPPNPALPAPPNPALPAPPNPALPAPPNPALPAPPNPALPAPPNPALPAPPIPTPHLSANPPPSPPSTSVPRSGGAGGVSEAVAGAAARMEQRGGLRAGGGRALQCRWLRRLPECDWQAVGGTHSRCHR